MDGWCRSILTEFTFAGSTSPCRHPVEEQSAVPLQLEVKFESIPETLESSYKEHFPSMEDYIYIANKFLIKAVHAKKKRPSKVTTVRDFLCGEFTNIASRNICAKICAIFRNLQPMGMR